MFDLGTITLAQYVLVAVTAFAAAVLGGVTGYGTGLLLPPVLVPIIGAEAVIPVIAVAAVATNASRLAAFWTSFDRRKAGLVVACALPTCLAGAYGYTRLSGAGVAVLIGAVLIALVPVRRIVTRIRGHLQSRGLAAAAAGYGLLVGGTSGSGIVLLSLLLAAGLHSTAVIATDAGISVVLGLVKVAVFQATGVLPLSSWILAALIGLCATPGAFVAKRYLSRLSGNAHTAVLDGVVILGGALLILQGLRGLSA